MNRIAFYLPRRRPILLVILGILSLVTSGLRADQSAATQPGFEVKEWLILVSAPNQPHANSSSVFTFLPDVMDPLRAAPPGEPSKPCPVGVIRVSGQIDTKFAIRLTTPDDGLFYTSWPLAHIRSPNLEWADLLTSHKPLGLKVPGDLRWLSPLREANDWYLNTNGRSETFLLYDAEFPFFLPLVLDGATDDGEMLRVRNRGDATIRDIALYRPPRTGSGWSAAHVPDVFAKSDSAPPTTMPTMSDTVRFSPIDGDPANYLANDWKQRLASWDLNPSDLDVIASILRTYAIDDRQTTAIFRLEESEINRLLPLHISPTPAKVRRLALVVARNIDPALPQIIDRLVSQLGDPDWHKREAASKALAAFGPAANTRLREALRSGDPEIVMRSERLLAHNALR